MKDTMISTKKLMEAYFKFRLQKHGENVLYASISPPEMDKILKACIEEKPIKKVKDGDND